MILLAHLCEASGSLYMQLRY